MSTESPRARACALCENVVEAYGTQNEGIGWQHTILADNARWALPVESYQVAPGNMNEGDWAACDTCADALRAHDWNKIVYRAMKAHRALGGPMRKETFEYMYRDLRTHMTGPVLLEDRPTNKEDE